MTQRANNRLAGGWTARAACPRSRASSLSSACKTRKHQQQQQPASMLMPPAALHLPNAAGAAGCLLVVVLQVRRSGRRQQPLLGAVPVVFQLSNADPHQAFSGDKARAGAHPRAPLTLNTLARARPRPSSRMERVSTPTSVDLPLSTLPITATRTCRCARPREGRAFFALVAGCKGAPCF